MNFLIETNENRELLYDFQYTVIEEIKRINWFNDEIIHNYFYSNELDCLYDSEFIPIGSVKFVETYFKKKYNIDLKPLNFNFKWFDYKYLGREIWYDIKRVPKDIQVFVKDIGVTKGFVDILNSNNLHKVSDKLKIPFISEVVDIESEWRCFVYKSELLDCKNYIGLPFNPPNEDTLDYMIALLKYLFIHDFPYTLDVAVLSDGSTVILEVHNFYSCGLYGFKHKKLLNMLIDTFNYMKGNGFSDDE